MNIKQILLASVFVLIILVPTSTTTSYHRVVVTSTKDFQENISQALLRQKPNTYITYVGNLKNFKWKSRYIFKTVVYKNDDLDAKVYRIASKFARGPSVLHVYHSFTEYPYLKERSE